VYDRAGNRTLINRQSYNLPFPYRETAVSYYGADERLRVTDKRTGPGEQNTSRASAYEEYRYDALGRRILVRSRKASDCTHSQFCLSTIDRFVWDGDQLLYEIRYPGGDGVSNALLERDTARIDVTGLPAPYGRVAYAHGLGIDRPLSIIRVNYGLSWYEPVAVFPHENWRGEFDIGTYDDGKVKRRDPQTLAEIVIDWPAENLSVFLSPRQAREPNSWFGSLLRNKRDGSELLYMRNRYYDAKQGRFTQEDPIGLAGGMNAYGFANGDPVNFSDPFGLCPSCVGAVGSVAAGWAIAELTGQDYTWKQAALDAAIGAAGVGLASKAGKLASLVRGADDIAAGPGRVVIGETMKRVRAHAASIGAETFETTAKTAKQMWKENSSFLRRAMHDGKEIVDIGEDANRAIRSKFYQAEKELIERRGYPTTTVPR